MKKKQSDRPRFFQQYSGILLAAVLTLLLAGCGTSQPTTVGAGTTPTPAGQATASATAGGGDLTACPPAGKARAASMPDLTQSSPSQFVFFTNSGAPQSPANAVLKRYDVRSNTATTIISLPATWIMDAQVSRDGKWILFTANVHGHSVIQMVRVDGQYHQTLYCAQEGEDVKSLTFAGSTSTQLSPDQQHLVFAAGPDMGAPTLYLMTMNSGQLDILLKPANPTRQGYMPRTWLDNSRIFLIGMLPNSDAPPRDLYLLDTGSGVNQPENKLQRVLSTENLLCWDFDSSYDASQLFFNQCEPKAGALGSGRIDQFPPMGGAPRLIHSSQKLAITHVRTFEYGKASRLLFSVYNSVMGINADHSQDGLWLINTDGSGLKRLTTSPYVELNRFSQYPWANVSRDGHYYVVATVNGRPGESIYYGSLDSPGGQLSKIAARSTGTDEVYPVGWTAA